MKARCLKCGTRYQSCPLGWFATGDDIVSEGMKRKPEESKLCPGSCDLITPDDYRWNR